MKIKKKILTSYFTTEDFICFYLSTEMRDRYMFWILVNVMNKVKFYDRGGGGGGGGGRGGGGGGGRGGAG